LKEYEDSLQSVKKGLSLDPSNDMLMETLKELGEVLPGSVTSLGESEEASLEDDEEMEEVEVEVDSSSSVQHQTVKMKKESSSSKKSPGKLNKKLKPLKKTTEGIIFPRLPPHAPEPQMSGEDEEGEGDGGDVKHGVVVGCQTTNGNFYVEVFKSWAPIGAKRFLELVESHFFDSKVTDECIFFHYIKIVTTHTHKIKN
jgi:hypothetical protein